jgi:TRAP-type C4-dicarboxylate transport system permease small subunit
MWREIARYGSRAAQALGGGLFLALLVVFVLQVVSRFVFNRPLPWTDELAVVLYVWIILWACATLVPAREHVMFDLVWQVASPRARRLMAILGHGLVGGLSLWALPASWDYVSFMSREATPVLDIPFSLVFLPFVVLLGSLVIRSVGGIHQAWRGEGIHGAPPPEQTP